MQTRVHAAGLALASLAAATAYGLQQAAVASAAAQKLVERGSCCEFGVVDPFEGGGGGVAVFDEGEHAGDEIIA